jgi:hypothetical protein
MRKVPDTVRRNVRIGDPKEFQELFFTLLLLRNRFEFCEKHTTENKKLMLSEVDQVLDKFLPEGLRHTLTGAAA